MEDKQVRKITLGFVLGWIFGVILLLAGFTYLFSGNVLPAILIMLIGFILLPPANTLLANKFGFVISGGLKVVLVLVLLILIGTIEGNKAKEDGYTNKDTENSAEDEKSSSEANNTEEVVENTEEENPVIEDTEEIIKEKENGEVIPEWYGKTYKIDSAEFEGLSYQKVSLWKSYNERTLIISVPRYAEVTLKGYRSDYDYCQLEYQNKVGWSACAWIKGLPEDMVDYWVK